MESAARLAGEVGGTEPSLAIGYREISSQPTEHNRAAHRHLFSGVYRRLAREFLGIDARDPQCGAKAMDASVWWQIRPTLRSGGFGWDTELLAIAASAGIPVSEHPVEWVDQPGTTVGITDPMRMLRQLVAAHRRASDTPTRQTAPNRTLRRESLRNTEPSVTDLGGDRIHRTARRQGSRLLSSLIRSLQTPTAWLTALGLLLYLPGLGGYPLRTWDEAICAMAARYAVERGDYVFPHLYWLASSSEIVYQPFLEKPSLSMWLMSISMALHRVRSPTATGPCRRSRRTSDVSRDTLHTLAGTVFVLTV